MTSSNGNIIASNPPQSFKSEGQPLPLSQQPSRPRVLHRAATIDEVRLYQKHGQSAKPSTSQNGNFGGLERKIIHRQNSLFFPPASASSSTPKFLSPSGSASFRFPTSGGKRLSSVVDTDKLLAAQKRRQDAAKAVAASTKSPIGGRIPWTHKIRNFTTICVTTLLLLTTASLLFISILIADPILVGLKAQFKSKPGICRTSRSRNMTGPGNCVSPSCREGCTADLYTCTYIYVTYFEVPNLNQSFTKDYFQTHQHHPHHSSERLEMTQILAEYFLQSNSSWNHDLQDSYRHSNITAHGALLMINPNGCGYPPEVNCSNFYDEFSGIGSLFFCFYSNSSGLSEIVKENGGLIMESENDENIGAIAVPFYNRTQEIFNLGFYFGIPLGTVLILGCFLLILIRKPKPKKRKRRRCQSQPHPLPSNSSNNNNNNTNNHQTNLNDIHQSEQSWISTGDHGELELEILQSPSVTRGGRIFSKRKIRDVSRLNERDLLGRSSGDGILLIQDDDDLSPEPHVTQPPINGHGPRIKLTSNGQQNDHTSNDPNEKTDLTSSRVSLNGTTTTTKNHLPSTSNNLP